MMKPKAENEHSTGMLEYLEDVIGTVRYKVSFLFVFIIYYLIIYSLVSFMLTFQQTYHYNILFVNSTNMYVSNKSHKAEVL